MTFILEILQEVDFTFVYEKILNFSTDLIFIP